MQPLGLWQVTGDGPRKLNWGGIALEQYLEEWIERDPALLQNGLTVVGRQVAVEGGQLDLLALDPQGRWVVIEIKSGTVRRETIAQALDYASCIARMPHDELKSKIDTYLKQDGTSLHALLEESGADEDGQADARDVVMFVVGTGRDPGLERMVNYLSGTFDVPINVVTFEVFELEAGQQVLVRELTETEVQPPDREKRTVEDICAIADRSGIGSEFRTILDAAQKHNLHPRPYKVSIMYTPPSNRPRMLFTVWARPTADGLVRVYVGPEAFAEFYPVAQEAAAAILGPDGWRKMTQLNVAEFIAKLDRLFATMDKREDTAD